MILRHRRRGTFVNPHWLRPRSDEPEVRVVVPEGPWGQLFQDAARSGPRLNLVTVPRPALHQALTHAVAEGQAPDLAVLDSVWIPEFAAAGFLHPLEELDADWVHSDYEGDFLGPVVGANRYGGRTFGVSAFADVAGLWYLRHELESAGLDPPATWADLRAAAREVRRRGLAHPIVMPGGSKAGETTSYCLIAILASNGAQVLGPDSVGLDSREAAQALRFLRGLVDERLMPADVVGYGWDRPVRLLAQGEAAFSFGGSYEARGLAEALGVRLGDLWEHVGFVPVPAGPEGAPASVAGTMICAVFRQAERPRAAMRLLEAAFAPEALVGVARGTARIPARRSALELAAPGIPFLSETGEMLERAVTRPSTPLYPRVSAQLQAMLEAVLTGRLGAAAAARRAAELIGAITGLPVGRQDEPAIVEIPEVSGPPVPAEDAAKALLP